MNSVIKRIGLGMTCFAAINAAAKEKPVNFIVILMDDMGYGDMSCYGAIDYKTPNIDRMAVEGMRFTHFYAAQPVSGASRAGLMTGCYPNRIGFSGAPNPLSKIGINKNEETIAEVLKKKGYYCAAFGKWHLGHHKQFLPTHNGFDEYYGIPYSNDMNRDTTDVKLARYQALPLIEGDEVVERNPDQTRFTTDFTERAINVIDKHKDSPFFIYLAHPMPHVPLHVSNKFKGKSKQGMYGDVIMEIDWSVGQILDKLKKEDLEEKTLVVVTSDNGPWIKYGNHAGSTAGLREGKLTTFEGGQRVPCIMKWKGVIEAGVICNNLASSIDLLPTFASIADAKLPNHKIDGLDISPMLTSSGDEAPRKDFYFYYRKNSLEAVTDGTYKLVFPHKHISYEDFPAGRDGKPGEFTRNKEVKEMMLFDLRSDAGERNNVIKQYPEVVARLMEIANNARNDLGDDLQGIEGKNRRPIGTLRK